MKNKILYILKKNINNHYKLIPFKVKKENTGIIKYNPPVSNEWRNTTYAFNQNNIKNLPIYDINIYSLIKSYFNSYLNFKFLNDKYISRKKKRKSRNKIYISKAKVKHTNSKAILTIYTYNREKIVLLKKIKKVKNFLRFLQFLMRKKPLLKKKFATDNNYLPLKIKKDLKLIRSYSLRLKLNIHKFQEKLLYILSSLVSKYYNKKVEFHIVNMKSFILNSDLFTQILTLKLKRKNKKKSRMNDTKLMDYILDKAPLAQIKRVVHISNYQKKKPNKNINFIVNKYKNRNIISILKKNNLMEFLNKIYYNVNGDISNDRLSLDYDKAYEIIFNSIKYKNIGGIRLQIKGRLSKRYRADRSISRVRLKGGLKNIYSSFYGLSSVIQRGYLEPNVEYSIFTSKRRIGAYSVKGWISGI